MGGCELSGSHPNSADLLSWGLPALPRPIPSPNRPTSPPAFWLAFPKSTLTRKPRENINNTAPPLITCLAFPSCRCYYNRRTAHPLDQVYTPTSTLHPSSTLPSSSRTNPLYFSKNHCILVAVATRPHSYLKPHTFLPSKLFTMSGANSWLQRQRKGDLVELAQQSGLTKYVCTRHVLLRFAFALSILEFWSGFPRVLLFFPQLQRDLKLAPLSSSQLPCTPLQLPCGMRARPQHHEGISWLHLAPGIKDGDKNHALTQIHHVASNL